MKPKNFRNLVESAYRIILNEQGPGGVDNPAPPPPPPPEPPPPPPPIEPPEGEGGWTHPSGEPWGPDNGGQEYPPGSGNWYDPGWITWWFSEKHQDSLYQQQALELEIDTIRKNADDPPTDGGRPPSDSYHSWPPWLKKFIHDLQRARPGGF